MIDKKERHLIDTIIKDGMCVFDVGVNKGEWIGLVLGKYKNISAHVFDPIPGILSAIAPGTQNKITKNSVAVSDVVGEKEFYVYEQITELSTIYRRGRDIEEQFHLAPRIIKAPTCTLDEYCAERGVKAIDFLKIDVEGAELDVFHGAQELLRSKRVANLQFEYGGCNIDSKHTLLDMHFYLRSVGYDIYKMEEARVIPFNDFDLKMEDYQLTNYYAKPGA